MEAFLISFGIIFVAELGDKSQLMAMTFAARYRAIERSWSRSPSPPQSSTSSACSSAPRSEPHSRPMRSPSSPASPSSASRHGRCAVTSSTTTTPRERPEPTDRCFVTVGMAFFLAELGDKTMLATITLATDNGLFGTWLGSTVGMVAADALAIVVGQQLGARLPERTVRIGAAITFVVFGVLLIIEGLR